MGKGAKTDSNWVSALSLQGKASLPSKGEMKAAIPSSCFNRSTFWSLMYVARDSIMAAACLFLALQILSLSSPPSLFTLDGVGWILGWNLYAFWMGTILTGHWVLAHECGHGAFSDYPVVNDIIGFLLHQALLVPYFSWKYSHAKHHRRTNSLVDGESHVPATATESGLGPNNERLGHYAALHEMIGDGPFAVFQVFTHLAIGWPIYLCGLASTGRKAYDGSLKAEGEVFDHFRPKSRLFPPKMWAKVAASTIGIFVVLMALIAASNKFGAVTVGLVYGGPYLVVNAWLVLYTWLQHSDPSVPHYGDDEWTWVRGSLCTIDRPYGIFDFFHHKIGSTHVVHHLFHEIPFYNADEATRALAAFLGPLYNYDPTPWPLAMWRVARTCHFVDGTNGVQYYRSMESVPKTKAE